MFENNEINSWSKETVRDKGLTGYIERQSVERPLTLDADDI